MQILLLAENDDLVTCEEFWDLICDSVVKIQNNVTIGIYKPLNELRELKLNKLHKKDMKYFNN